MISHGANILSGNKEDCNPRDFAENSIVKEILTVELEGGCRKSEGITLYFVYVYYLIALNRTLSENKIKDGGKKKKKHF